MEKRKLDNTYIYTIMGAIGMLLLVFGLLEYMYFIGSTANPGFLLTFGGFLILINYIYYLEKRAGVSTKAIWIKSLFLGLAVFIFAYIKF